jgi:hypothetical protein
MRRELIGIVACAALWHWACCKCADIPTAPATSASPVAAATPSPSSSPAGCNLPAATGTPICRPEPPPRFENQVVQAQAQVRREHPELFDGQGRVISALQYSGWVASTLRSSFGLCAAAVGGDGTDEVGVKNTNDWNEQYDIVTGNRETWTNYTVTCRPPLF